MRILALWSLHLARTPVPFHRTASSQADHARTRRAAGGYEAVCNSPPAACSIRGDDLVPPGNVKIYGFLSLSKKSLEGTFLTVLQPPILLPGVKGHYPKKPDLSAFFGRQGIQTRGGPCPLALPRGSVSLLRRPFLTVSKARHF